MFEHKIKTIADIADWLEVPRPKTVLVNGVFDLVHPGHISHLLQAKKLGDILIASVTADEFVTKGDLRPYVPERLRALNLAALEMVDYVLIDRHPTPIETIKALKPDVFAKGYDYPGSKNPKTLEEIAAVEEYGGRFVTTAGDVVYSSSAIIKAGAPNLAKEKLKALLAAEQLNFYDLEYAFAEIAKLSCTVVGDLIIDVVTYATTVGIGTKTPTVSSRFLRREEFIGGAGIVALHVHGAGAKVFFVSVVGPSPTGSETYRAKEKLLESGLHHWLVEDRSRPTTVKHTYDVDGYRMLKVDTVDNSPISDEIASGLANLAGAESDVVIFSDFRHGIFNPASIHKFRGAISSKSFLAVDSQVASRWGNVLDFAGADLVMVNEREARFVLGDQDSTIRPLGRRLYDAAACRTLILKLGDRGAITFRDSPSEGLEDARAWFVVDSFAREVVDPIGAGDAFLAYAALAMRATGNAVIATIIGSIAAGLECEREGNMPVTAAEVIQRIKELEV